MKFILLAGLLGMAAAECPDACNGHGFCGQFDKCSCYRNWMGNSCDKRTCPYDLSFVDLPQGDLDMDGSGAAPAVSFGAQINNRKGYEVWPHDADNAKEGFYDQPDDGHFYAECSNKGMCDRKSGLCSCFDGYEGTACRRVVCPNDCSGHGTCERMEEFGQTYALWDRYKAQVCKCDPGYFGIDCSNRYCPRGDDPLTTGQQDETQWLDVNCGTVDCSGTFRISYTDTFGETWDTMPINLATYASGTAAAYATSIKAALNGIPNSVIEDATVEIKPIEDVIPGFAVHAADGDSDADTWTFAKSTAAEVNKFTWQNILPLFSALSTPTSADAVSRWTASKCNSVAIAMTGIVAGADAAGDILTVADATDYGATVCRMAKYGFRAKITFTKNPGALSAMSCTGGPATLACTASSTPNMLGAFGLTGSGQANPKRVTTNMDLTDVLAVGDKVRTGVNIYTVASAPVAPANMDTLGYFEVLETTHNTNAVALTAIGAPAAEFYNTGTKELVECSHRGMCDHGAGVCGCFAGYTNDDCGMQQALAA